MESDKVLKTPIYQRMATKRYAEKNKEKMKEMMKNSYYKRMENPIIVQETRRKARERYYAKKMAEEPEKKQGRGRPKKYV